MLKRLLVIFLLYGCALNWSWAQSPQFQTWKDDPQNYKKPDYPLVFIATYRDPAIANGGNLGTDVLEAGAPSRGQELWLLLPDGSTERLFPIVGVHDDLVDYSIGPNNGRINGSVTEPSISIDGQRVYFSYFHDALNFPPYCCSSTGHSNFDGWPLGGDLYAIDLAPKLADPSFPVAQLRVSRLSETTNEYAHALNPEVASATEIDTGGIVYNGALEIDTEYGRRLIFASDRRLLRNANPQQTKKNKNFNLFSAEVKDDGHTLSLHNIRQLHYYTTTSGLSPNRLRSGFAFSYQAHTEDARQWQIQRIEGYQWGPLYGYGIGNEAAHLGAFCVKSRNGVLPRGDYEVLTQYYNANNNGFGFIVAQDMARVGLNRYDKPSGAGVGYLPEQLGSYNITPGVKKGDYKSITSEGIAIGKFTAPACGGPDELFLTYDPGWGNHKNDAYQYFPEIVFSDLEPANPLTQPDQYKPVIRSLDPAWGAVWAKPVIDWHHRLRGFPHPTGNAQQVVTGSAIDPQSGLIPGDPLAILGTSSLQNTDIKPVDCKDSAGFYDPYETGNTADQILNNIDSLSRVIVDAPGNINAQTGACSKPLDSDLFGIAIYMTSNKINDGANSSWSQGYATDGSYGGSKESKRLLGVFKIGMQGQTDTSFKAIVPANVPIDFQLLDSNGLKLADVRSWHSLKPRETRTNCGGCHNHRAGEHIAWESSDSYNPALLALNMVDQTTYIDYDAFCRPELLSTSEEVREIPVWQDLSSQFHQYCGDCHADDGENTSVSSLNALRYDVAELDSLDAGGPLDEMFAKKYIDRYNANGSRLFWAAYGARSDGRNNNKPQYQPQNADYAGCTAKPKDCGYKFSSASHPGLCDGSNPGAAHWVYQLGLWIDNHAPTDTGKPYAYHYDRYHPSVDTALFGGKDCMHPQFLNIGFWDDSGALDQLKVDLNGQAWIHVSDPDKLDNGYYPIATRGISLQGFGDYLIKITASDATGNRQIYEKSVAELVIDCVAGGGQLPGSPPAQIAKPVENKMQQ